MNDELTALVDGDIIAYRCAAASNEEPEDVAILRTDQMLLEALGESDNFIIFLTGDNNFRYEVYPDYKANRKDVPKPQWLNACKDYLVREYGAVVTNGYEADDAMGMSQNDGTVIYTIDKDLDMIPGQHYNFVKKQYYVVDEVQALKVFYKQMLIGDRGDNIFGVHGLGKVKAGRLIDPLDTEDEMREAVMREYVRHFSYPDAGKLFRMNADCLWIWRNNGETYSKRMERGETQELHNLGAEGGEQD